MISPICLIESNTQRLCILINVLATQKHIIKQIRSIVIQRLNKISSNEENFLKTKHDYELTMKKKSYNDKLNFETTEQ